MSSIDDLFCYSTSWLRQPDRLMGLRGCRAPNGSRELSPVLDRALQLLLDFSGKRLGTTVASASKLLRSRAKQADLLQALSSALDKLRSIESECT
jgi:hypothetical protein